MGELKGQKPIVNENRKKKHQRIVDVLQKENNELLQEKQQLEKKYRVQNTLLQQNELQFIKLKNESKQLERNAKRVAEDFENTNQSVLDDLIKKRDALIEEYNTNKKLADKNEARFKDLKKSLNTSPKKVQKKVQFKYLHDNENFLSTLSGLREYVVKLEKKKTQDLETIGKLHEEIETLNNEEREERERLIFMSRGSVEVKTQNSLNVYVPERFVSWPPYQASEPGAFQGETFEDLSLDDYYDESDTENTHEEVSQKDHINLAEKEFFVLTCLGVKLNSGHNMDDLMAISTEMLWEKAVEEKIKFHQYHSWIEGEITKMYYRYFFKKNKDIPKVK